MAEKNIKVAVVPGDAPARITYEDGSTVAQLLEKAHIRLNEESEVRLDGELVEPENKVQGDHLCLVVGKRTSGN